MRTRSALASLLLLLLATPAVAQSHKPGAAHSGHAAGPAVLGRFADWTAATNKAAGQTECYAFTRAAASTPTLPGRGDVVLTVTERPGGRDAVAISAGFAYAPDTVANVAADATAFDFYTAGRFAFARDGHAAALAFARARQVQARSPAAGGNTVTDRFGLRGFSAAYAAIQKACPAGKVAS